MVASGSSTSTIRRVIAALLQGPGILPWPRPPHRRAVAPVRSTPLADRAAVFRTRARRRGCSCGCCSARPTRRLVALYRALLEGDGHTAVGAPTMESAARLAGPWDVVLVGGLPNSRRHARRARRRAAAHPGARAPIALVAERVWTEDARPADLGVAAIVPKPFELDELLGAVRAAGSADDGVV